MGLHICYELRLSGSVTAKEAAACVRKLRKHARTLGADYVSPIIWLTASDLTVDLETLQPCSFERCVRVYADMAWEERGGMASGLQECEGWVAAAFLMSPGDGCEAAFFGLMQPVRGERRADADQAADADNWFWHSFCKTQYASAVSDAHLVKCHLTVVHMLEAAQQIGIGVTVSDETNYWETRSTEVLIDEVRRMNQIVARFAGALHDAAPGLSLEAPIFEHPDFERLESEPARDQ